MSSRAGWRRRGHTGFSALAMMLSIPASSVLLLWAIIVGACLWRLAPLAPGPSDRLRQGCGGPPKLSAKAEDGPLPTMPRQ